MMKTYFRILTATFLLVLTLCLCLTGCNGDPAEPAGTGETTAAVTDISTDPADTADETEEPTEAPTEAPTEVPTEPVTEAPALMSTVDVDVLADQDLGDYFTRSSKCDVKLADDATEGKVLRLSTSGITTVNSGKPTVYFKLADLVGDVNGIMPSTLENPYLVLKVRAGDLWSRTFGIQAGQSVRTVDTGAALLSARLDNTEEWQYIYFDLTGFDKELEVFYLCFEYGAAKDGEYLDIAELRFVATEEEAIALAGTDTYPVNNQTADDYTLKVMSFNVQTENGTQVDFALRAEMFRDLLDELQPDSIGMQEVTVKWIEWMDSFSFNDSYAGVGEGRTPGGEASSIYYRKDKFELVDSGTFWLSDTPDKVGSAVANANYPRICTWVHLRDKETGLEYVHLNTHLDHNGDNKAAAGREVRLAQVKVILEFIETLGDLPMVMTGDFNQAHINSKNEPYPMYKYITGQDSYEAADGTVVSGSFSDARLEAAETVSTDTWATMTAYHQEGNSKYDPAHKPIDYVFYTADHFDATVYKSIHYHRDGIYMSDHLPQYCELHVKSATAE